MFKLYKKAFLVTNDAIVLTIPLTLFWLVLTLYIDYSKSVVDTLPEIILSAITMLFMTSAFCAGWFYMVKRCIKFSRNTYIIDAERNKESLKLLKSMSHGIGKFFMHYVTASILFVTIAVAMAFIIKVLSYTPVKTISDTLALYNIPIGSLDEVQMGLDKLQYDIILNLFKEIFKSGLTLILIVFLIPAIVSFLLMLWMPEIIYTYKNPFIAIITSVKKLFTNFGKSIKLYIYISLLQMFISILGTLSLGNMFIYMIAMLVYFYFITYVVVLIFMFYEENFIRKKRKL